MELSTGETIAMKAFFRNFKTPEGGRRNLPKDLKVLPFQALSALWS
jgi:hypothetical protein